MVVPQYRDYTLMQQMIVEMQLIKKQYASLTIDDMTKPIITPAADYSLVGCNTAWPTISAPWTDNCGVGGAKSGNIDGVAEQYKLVPDGCSQYRDYTFNATDDCGNAADQKNSTHHSTTMTTKPIITPAADYSLVGCNTALAKQP
jgi:hypothetical protein